MTKDETSPETQDVRRVGSADGTQIAFEVFGEGPRVIFVTGMLSDRTSLAELARDVAGGATSVIFDRRGRGDSETGGAYAVAREVEDVAALAGLSDVSPILFGHSSGAGLAIEAAASGLPLSGLILYEPPYGPDDADSRADSASQASTVLRHGPPPSLGLKQMFSEDGVCPLYLMRLDGAVDALFPMLAPTETKRAIIKVGISREPARRERELNAGFPRGAQARWTLRDIRPYPSVGAAYDAEGLLLEGLAREGRWISGEFAIVPYAELGALLHI